MQFWVKYASVVTNVLWNSLTSTIVITGREPSAIDSLGTPCNYRREPTGID